MKRKFLIASMALLCLSTAGFAQTEKGNYLIGGSISYSSNKNSYTNIPNANSIIGSNTQKFNTTTISPRIGYFFSKNLVVGLDISYVNSKSTNEISYVSNNTTSIFNSINKSNFFGGGPFVRYYTDLAKKFKFFGQLSTGVSFGKSSAESRTSSQDIYNITKYKNTNFSGSINPGFAFFPSKKWEIEFSFPLLAYSNQNTKDDGVNSASNPSKSDSFYFGLNSFSPNIGFNYHF